MRDVSVGGATGGVAIAATTVVAVVAVAFVGALGVLWAASGAVEGFDVSIDRAPGSRADAGCADALAFAIGSAFAFGAVPTIAVATAGVRCASSTANLCAADRVRKYPAE